MRGAGELSAGTVIDVVESGSDDLRRGVGWLAAPVWHDIVAEVRDKAPLETGGVLLGYWVRYPGEGSDASAMEFEGGEVVITQGLGPGPNAVHRPDSFSPDHEIHARGIARIYEKSGRVVTYLGDWHSHPTGTADLSRRDRATLTRIARARDARVPHPLMLVVVADDERRTCLWVGRLRRRRGLLRSLSIGLLKPRIFVPELECR